METFKTLWAMMTPRRRRQLLLTLALMVAGAAAELATIGAALPFLALLGGHAGAARVPLVGRFLSGLAGGGILPVALVLIASAVAAAAVRLLLVWSSQRFVAALGHDLATAIFSRMLRMPYAEFVRRNSSEVLASLEKVRDIVSSVLQPALQGLISLFLAAAIAALLFAIQPFATLTAGGLVVGLYFAISAGTRRRLKRNSAVLAESAVARTQIVQEGLGAIRDIILDQSQPLFEARFAAIDRRFRQALSANVFIAGAPRFVIEAAGIVAIALIALAMSVQPGGLVRAIPVLGALAIGAQRLLPLVQQVYNGWSLGLGNFGAVADVARLLAAPAGPAAAAPAGPPLPFARELAFERVGFGYASGGFALEGVDFRVAPGERIGIVGATGSGKSTLLDLLMGLLSPSAGEIRVDGVALDEAARRRWQPLIAHVPQSVYLSDDTIAANIAFGIPPGEADAARIAAAARAARLETFVAGLPEGFATRVGERGIRLSGGQRQRIGLARALYKAAPVLVLDEATSALDDATEAEVIESIHALGRDTTLFMIAHRRTTLAGCDRILHVEAGRVKEMAPSEALKPRRAREGRIGSGGGT
ncbi:MAG: ATP-binding cassette domain-containing protein [Allosphingosinicella sp.]